MTLFAKQIIFKYYSLHFKQSLCDFFSFSFQQKPQCDSVAMWCFDSKYCFPDIPTIEIYLSTNMLNSTNMAGFLTKSLSHIMGSSYYNNKTPISSPYILGTSPPDSTMELYILDNRLQVCSCPREKMSTLCHSIIKMALLPDSRFVFFIKLSCFEIYLKYIWKIKTHK